MSDWLWMVRKVQRRISRWLSKWLSLGGWKTLVISVLQAIPVYWFSLFRVPSGILSALKQLFFHFLWRGTSENFRFHLENWSFLSLPFSWGGWGFKQLGIFNLSLCAKILRWGLSRTGLWGHIISAKYMKRIPLSSWLSAGNFKSFSPSMFWSSLCSDLPCILRCLKWKVGRGNNINVCRSDCRDQ